MGRAVAVEREDAAPGGLDWFIAIALMCLAELQMGSSGHWGSWGLERTPASRSRRCRHCRSPFGAGRPLRSSRLLAPFVAGQAFAEYGRVAKTLHLLAYVDVDDAYRRQIGAQPNIQESRHRLARRIFHGQRGELRQRYREGQEDQLGALGLVLNAVVLWNTRYMDLALGQLPGRGVELQTADVTRLSPLGFRHVDFLGRYAFTLPEPGRGRPLQDPDAAEEEDDEAVACTSTPRWARVAR